MSVAFSSARPRSKGEVTQQAIQKVNNVDAALFWLNIPVWVGVCTSAVSTEKVACDEY